MRSLSDPGSGGISRVLWSRFVKSHGRMLTCQCRQKQIPLAKKSQVTDSSGESFGQGVGELLLVFLTVAPE